MATLRTYKRRKLSGGRYTNYVPRRKSQLASSPTLTRVDATKRKTIRVLGGNTKSRLLRVQEANLMDKSGKSHKVKVLSVVENPANRHFIRRNIITKGSIIETEMGNAKVTSRPGQVGTLNAVLI